MCNWATPCTPSKIFVFSPTKKLKIPGGRENGQKFFNLKAILLSTCIYALFLHKLEKEISKNKKMAIFSYNTSNKIDI